MSTSGLENCLAVSAGQEILQQGGQEWGREAD